MIPVKPVQQRGAFLILTVLFLVVLLGFAALALDLGRLYVLRTEMQNAADAAALAAAAELDGSDTAIEDAVLAATDLLSHRGRFADEPELLNMLSYDPNASPEDNAFEFYSWINAETDPAEPSSCTHPPLYGNPGQVDENKCLALPDGGATASSLASYVRVKLHPDLVNTGDTEYYQISLYFLPVLGLFLDDGTIQTASTRVTAVAGAGGPVFCKYPPMFMCAFNNNEPDDDGVMEADEYPGIIPGQQILLKDKSASDPWGPGNVGFLDVGEDIEIPLDDDGGVLIEKNIDAMSAAIGNEFIRKECTPAIVSTQTGTITQKTRQALNTRFGLYETYENAKEAFPPAPNTVDYPLDDEFSEESDDYDPDAKIGSGWENTDTECLNGPGGPLEDPECYNSPGTVSYTRPETFGRNHYIAKYHESNPNTPPVTDTRYELYRWEIDNPGTAPSPYDTYPYLTLDDPDELPLDDRNATSQEDCSERSVNKPGSQHCQLHNSKPIDGDSTPGDYRRRVIRVAVIKCGSGAGEQDIQGNTPDIDLNYANEFPFHEFFFTQHAQAASDTKFYIEYVGPVSEEKDIQEIRHTIIQLYE